MTCAQAEARKLITPCSRLQDVRTVRVDRDEKSRSAGGVYDVRESLCYDVA